MISTQMNRDSNIYKIARAPNRDSGQPVDPRI